MAFSYVRHMTEEEVKAEVEEEEEVVEVEEVTRVRYEIMTKKDIVHVTVQRQKGTGNID